MELPCAPYLFIFALMNLPSKLIEEAVDQMASLPGVGRKTALRLVLNLLKRDESEVESFAGAFMRLRENINYCKQCHNLSDEEVCSICSNPHREDKLVCVVEDIRDVMAIESTQQFRGKYHVLGGIISPMDGIGPGDINAASLIDRVKNQGVEEVIFALSTTMEGETTAFYLFKKLDPMDVKLSSIARGVSMGDQLEFADEVTLGRSIVNRTPYENSLSKS